MQEATPSENGTPFFIVGSVRSGSTLLRLLLGHHSQICKCEEMEFVAQQIAGREIPENISEYLRFLHLDRGFGLSGYTVDESLRFEEIARDFLEQRRVLDNCPVVGATVHHNFDELPRIWPIARYIFLNRDPRDVARSCVQMGFVGSAWAGAEYWINASDAWTQLTDRVPATSRMEIRFEDLVQDPEGTLRGVCSLLGVAFEPAMLEIDSDTTYSRPDPILARSWRGSAKPREIAQIETRIGKQVIQAAGYEASEFPGIRLNRINRLRISAEDLTSRMLFKVKKYGFWLWAQSVVARRLPHGSYREKIQLRINEINNANLK